MAVLYEKDLTGRWVERGRSEKVMYVQHCGCETRIALLLTRLAQE
jgi:hypothetical protein